MNQSFYVSPHQLMKDRADFARQGISRGKPVVLASCAAGIVLVTENTSTSLRKLSEIYDRIGLGAVGRYNEFEALRQNGVRYADTRGYAYDRADVTARGLVSHYAGILGELFLTGAKPLEVDIAVAEVGASLDDDRLYRVSFDGTVTESTPVIVIGGGAEQLQQRLSSEWDSQRPLDDAITAIQSAWTDASGEMAWETAVLDRDRAAAGGRSFQRRGHHGSH